MGTAFNPAKTSPASWDTFFDVDAFVDAVLAELAAMAADGTRSARSGPKLPLTGAALRRVIMAIWCVAFCGMQWRAIGLLCDIPFGTLSTLFARWTWLGLWRRLLNRLIRAWRQACGDKLEPKRGHRRQPLLSSQYRVARSYVAAATDTSFSEAAAKAMISSCYQEDADHGGSACCRGVEG
jgi:hypothetical protein